MDSNMPNLNSYFLNTMLFLLITNTCSALTFNIVPSRQLPTTVPQFGSVGAYYKITNTTNSSLNNNFVKSLPNGVTQTTCQVNFCGATFNLGPSGSSTDSCILKLNVKSADNDTEHHPLIVCTEDEGSCDGTDSPLNLTEDAPSAIFGISAGNYSDNVGRFFPLLAETHDNGDTWTYPRAILDNLTSQIAPNFYAGLLRAAACSGKINEAVCVAPGSYCTDVGCNEELPLIAVGKNNLNSWFYPDNVFTDLTTRVDSNFRNGSLYGSSCSGFRSNATCIASGEYRTSANQYPLLALTSNGGSTWTYPPSIFQNLKTTIDPSFSNGFLLGASCNPYVCDEESICIATGAFCSGVSCDLQLPLIATSTDKGKNWIYPKSAFQDVKNKIDPNFVSGQLKSASCSGSGNASVCIAAGEFFNKAATLPLIALSRGRGATWTYPNSIFQNLTTTISPDLSGAALNAASCAGSGLTARCIAAGEFTTDNGAEMPLIALTKDSGQSWSYPPFIYTKLKTLVDPNFVSGRFNGATCIGKSGKETICAAAGRYCRDQPCTQSFPLIAVSLDGGKTWQYPPSVYTNLTSIIDSDFLLGYFNSISCTGIGLSEGTEGYSLCVASGQYSTHNATYPLLAYSKDNGMTWNYPPYIFQNLTSTINDNFTFGFFSQDATAGAKITKQKN